MTNEEQDRRLGSPLAANDDGAAARRLETAVLTLARLIGRQIARESFAEGKAANDNREPR
ncbi:hypothetical protein [Pelagibius sp.]|uniref:hypothetical protein n=1 Tax=Pelagibius sp. TaxID=1931238 RepID=UPI003B502AEA